MSHDDVGARQGPWVPAGYVPVPVQPPTNGMAIAALVTGVMGLAVIPIVLGHLSLREIRRRGQAGTGLAVTGLVLGYATLVGYLVVVAVVAGAIYVGVTKP